ncbi:MAG: DUF3224 domain-containing protein [Alteromonadaceae bacterium]|nr:DUF3224 domain-containing protein [Alteromonadaceae bacterium]
MQLTGTFSITDWQEDTQKSHPQGGKLNKAVVTQAYTGDIVGTSEVHYQLLYSDDGNAHFNGFECLTGTINNQSYQLLICLTGEFTNAVASGRFTIIDCRSEHCQPELALTGMSGHFRSTQGGEATYTFETNNNTDIQ